MRALAVDSRMSKSWTLAVGTRKSPGAVAAGYGPALIDDDELRAWRLVIHDTIGEAVAPSNSIGGT